jgi:hypothetical protein
MVVGGTDSDIGVLTKVVDSQENDITLSYKKFCKDNGYDISKKSQIEDAAVPFINHFHASLL